MSEVFSVNGSSRCNKLLVKQLRERRNMTQADLARAAGYSERLVVKAEAGKSLSRSTLQDLAVALSLPGDPIFPEDLICDPVQLARLYIEMLYTKQADLVTHYRPFLADDVVFRVAGDPQHIPFAGEHRGITAVDRAFRIFFSVLEVPPNYDDRSHYRYLAQGTDVVVWGESWIHPIGRPMQQPMTISILMRFRKGKLYLFDDRFDTQHAADVLQDPPPETD